MSETKLDESDQSNHLRTDHSLGPLPLVLDSPQAKLVYLTLLISSSMTVDELHASLHMPLLALYPTLETLVAHGIVAQEGAKYRCTYDDHE
jgi:predicted transcriptional regulator